MGDLNYRVDKFTYDETVAMVGEGNCHILAQVHHPRAHTTHRTHRRSARPSHLTPPLSPTVTPDTPALTDRHT